LLATKHLLATEANFSLHRIKNQVGWGGRAFDIEFSNGGRMEGPLIVGAGCADDAKKVPDLGLAMLVTHCQQVSKKKFSFWDCCVQTYADLIEKVF
jgi:hypothetical protein